MGTGQIAMGTGQIGAFARVVAMLVCFEGSWALRWVGRIVYEWLDIKVLHEPIAKDPFP